MTGNEYQSLAMRTNDRKATERISDKFDLLKFCKKNNKNNKLFSLSPSALPLFLTWMFLADELKQTAISTLSDTRSIQ